MITCVNGHQNPAGSTYCQVCNVYIDSTAEPTPPPTPDPEPVPPVTTLVKVTIALSTAQLTIDAGGEGSCELTSENGSEQPDEFVVELQGVSWGRVEPWLVPL